MCVNGDKNETITSVHLIRGTCSIWNAQTGFLFTFILILLEQGWLPGIQQTDASSCFDMGQCSPESNTSSCSLVLT